MSLCVPCARVGRAARGPVGREVLALGSAGTEGLGGRTALPCPGVRVGVLSVFLNLSRLSRGLTVLFLAAISPRAVPCFSGFGVYSYCGPKWGFSQYEDFFPKNSQHCHICS